MKNILEISDTFQLYAQIDCCYFMIEQIKNELDKPLSPMHRLIDINTGYESHKTKEHTKNAIELLRQVIECKKKIEADYSTDKKFMNQLIKNAEKHK